MSETKVRPLGSKVFVKRLEAESQTPGGIILPDNAKEKPKKGTVISVGTGRLLDNGTRVPVSVKSRDQVIFASYAGTELKLNNDEYLILDENDILAVVD